MMRQLKQFNYAKANYFAKPTVQTLLLNSQHRYTVHSIKVDLMSENLKYEIPSSILPQNCELFRRCFTRTLLAFLILTVTRM